MSCPHPKTITRDYDNVSRLERRSMACEACGTFEEEVNISGGVCYPQNAADMLDLGLDPYIIEAFGVGPLISPLETRRARPTESRGRARQLDDRPSDEDEAWRQERSRMLSDLAKSLG